MHNLLNSKDQKFFDGILKQLSAEFSTPTPDLPTVRCIARPSLTRRLNAYTKELGIPGRKAAPASEVIAHLVTSGLFHPINVETAENHPNEARFYSIGVGSKPDAIHPIELLVASSPSGIICYFTALQMHEFTTQIPIHHHIGILSSHVTRSQESTQRDEPRGNSRKRAPANPLGSLMFSYQGQDYYRNSRDSRLVPGIERRYLNDKTIYKVTSLEQTLLDTLHRPLPCGGPAVVFEAWSTGLERMNEQSLFAHLQTIANPLLWRRVGYMLENCGYRPATAFSQQLDAIAEAAQNQIETDIVSLLHGIEYTNVNPKWLLRVP